MDSNVLPLLGHIDQNVEKLCGCVCGGNSCKDNNNNQGARASGGRYNAGGAGRNSGRSSFNNNNNNAPKAYASPTNYNNGYRPANNNNSNNNYANNSTPGCYVTAALKKERENRRASAYGSQKGPNCSVPREPRVPPIPEQDRHNKDMYSAIGEVAFQLERRVFNFCFPTQTRFYGYSLRNIETLIAREPDAVERQRQQTRFNQIIEKLRNANFLPYFHSELSSSLINQYGVLGRSLAEVRSAAQQGGFDDKEFITNVIRTKVPCSLQSDVLVILQCLILLSEEDGDPLFRW